MVNAFFEVFHGLGEVVVATTRWHVLGHKVQADAYIRLCNVWQASTRVDQLNLQAFGEALGEIDEIFGGELRRQAVRSFEVKRMRNGDSEEEGEEGDYCGSHGAQRSVIL